MGLDDINSEAGRLDRLKLGISQLEESIQSIPQSIEDIVKSKEEAETKLEKKKSTIETENAAVFKKYEKKLAEFNESISFLDGEYEKDQNRIEEDRCRQRELLISRKETDESANTQTLDQGLSRLYIDWQSFARKYNELF